MPSAKRLKNSERRRGFCQEGFLSCPPTSFFGESRNASDGKRIRATAARMQIAAISERKERDSPNNSHPKRSATKGLANAYVETRARLVGRSNYRYAEKHITDPN